ncbi:amino acid adenylation domain-containing protein [Rapidithrix thailandica]|uniref:Amino acid adenylation domain-containing protein n=1 Tax=Rapidithrix thailandica TaxID=413964 RepID=A0AAW9SIP8_9BACT
MAIQSGSKLELPQSYWEGRLDCDMSSIFSHLTLNTGQPDEFEIHPFTLNVSLTKKLKKLADLHEVSIHACIRAALQVFLYNFGEQEKVCLYQHTGKSLFHEVVPVEVDISSSSTLEQLLHVSAKQYNEASKYALPISVLEKLNVSSENVIGFAMLDSIPDKSAILKQWKDFWPKSNLSLLCCEKDGIVTCHWVYKKNLFSQQIIAGFSGSWQQLLKSVIEIPAQPLRNLNLVTPALQKKILNDWKGMQQAYQDMSSIFERFDNQVLKNTSKTALIYHGEDDEVYQTTFGELSKQVDELAQSLAALGVKPGMRVVIYTPRSEYTIAGLLAILKLRAVYVPVDESYPVEQVRQIVADTQARVLLTLTKSSNAINGMGVPSLCLDSEWVAFQPALKENTENQYNLDEEALILYTSGSTGKPKGVIHSQRQLINRFNWLWNNYPFKEDDVMGQRTMLNFLPSLWELLGGLLQGATTVILHNAVVKDPLRLSQAIFTHKISYFSMVPSLLRVFLASDLPFSQHFASMKLLITAGEPLSSALCNLFFKHLPKVKLLNDYGATEMNGVLFEEVEYKDKERVEVKGFEPIPNVEAYVLNGQGQLLPESIPGELHIGGPSLALGYLNQPKLTEEKFIPNPFSTEKGARIYKTGDMAYFTPEGKLIVTGRKDRQVKIRGVRIELKGIEDTILTHPEVEQCVLGIDGAEGKSKTLVAYIVPLKGKAPKDESFINYLSSKLPENYLPTRFQVIDRIPRTLSGKVDYASLNEVTSAQKSIANSSFQEDSLMGMIHKIACDILQQDQVDITKRWYAIGFDSISIVEFMNSLNRELKQNLSVASLYSHASVRELTQFLQAGGKGETLVEYIPVPKETGNIIQHTAAVEHREVKAKAVEKSKPQEVIANDIAVIGMSGKFPGANNLSEYWHNLINGLNSVTDFPGDRWSIDNNVQKTDSDLLTRGGFLENVDKFEPAFFHISHLEAELMDPQQRLLLEESWKALEDACYSEADLSGQAVGVFMGMRPGDYMNLVQQSEYHQYGHALMGNDMAILAARIAYFLNLKGPALALDTACSSSAVAIHMACKSIQAGESDMALAGGVCVLSTPWLHEMSGKLGMLSGQGQCKPFDANADGIVPAEGVGVVVLKSLEKALQDGDQIYGVIKASGINQDGKTNGITAPNAMSQETLIRSIYHKNKIDPASISYIETHGTGTKLGDPIEISALSNVFSKTESSTCNIGSVKANIGHPIASAGVAGLLKVLLALQNDRIPPQIHFENQNELLHLEQTPFKINIIDQEWVKQGRQPRRAALSSFGFSGTNAHMVIEEAPNPPRIETPDLPAYLFCFSAKSEYSLQHKIKDFLNWLEENKKYCHTCDLAFSTTAGRSHFNHRIAIVADNLEDLKDRLQVLTEGSGHQDIITRAAPKDNSRILQSIGWLVSNVGTKNKATYKEKLKTLAGAYVAGAQIEWKKLYNPESGCRRISIPAYPFEQTRHWVKTVKKRSNIAEETRVIAQEATGDVLPVIKIENWLKELFAGVINTPAKALRSEDPMEHYGIESIMIQELNKVLEKEIKGISKTLFFECQTIAQIALYLLQHHGDTMAQKVMGTNEDVPVVKPLANSNPESRPFRNQFSNTPSADKQVAIVGMSGRYPQAKDLNEFWQNLVNGKDCITEIPAERWDFVNRFSSDLKEKDKIHGKWGGFMEDVDKFDSLFFNISPKEAELIDPQERLFLEMTWHALEDAGYTRSYLQEYRVGVYLGATWSEYKLLDQDKKESERLYPNCSLASIPNRVSYWFNFHGPSIAIDTMCSSSLTALHYAHEALHRGEIDFAVVGGVNLSLHPYKYHLLSGGQFLSSEGKCRSFGQGGDGYVPGEGIGVMILTSQERALSDKTPIHALVKGTAINHGGKTNGYTVPNPNEQERLIIQALNEAKVDPETISYIEAHGTGTSLGDPIEVKGLTKAFEKFTNNRSFCALGSVKSNIGHLEACAGMAGITKVLLQMKHKTLVPSIHTDSLNENIDFANTPFYVQKSLQHWEVTSVKGNKEEALPRRAAVSSFGAGGANAHIILEEYPHTDDYVEQQPSGVEELVVLSARNKKQLIESAQNLWQFLESDKESVIWANGGNSVYSEIQTIFARQIGVEDTLINADDEWDDLDIDLVSLMTFNRLVSQKFNMHVDEQLVYQASSLSTYIKEFSEKYPHVTKKNTWFQSTKHSLRSIAYTLQVGREALDERVAFVVDSVSSLTDSLKRFIHQQPDSNTYTGNPKKARVNSEPEKEEIRQLIAERNLAKLAGLWVSTSVWDWTSFQHSTKGTKISLPLYPFKRERHWLPETEPALVSDQQEVQTEYLHPLLHKNGSSFLSQSFESNFHGGEFFFEDHKAEIEGIRHKVFPAASFLEMAYQAGKYSLENQNLILSNVIWEQPLIANEGDITAQCKLNPLNEGAVWTVSNKNIKCAQGQLRVSSNAETMKAPVDITAFNGKRYEKEQLYEGFKSSGMYYGNSFRSLQYIDIHGDSCLAKIRIPSSCREGLFEYTMHPSLLDGAFQTVIALMDNLEGTKTRYLPFSLKEMQISGPLPEELYVFTQLSVNANGSNDSRVFDIYLLTNEGKVITQLKEFTIKSLGKTVEKGQHNQTVGSNLYFQPAWKPQDITTYDRQVEEGCILWITDENTLYEEYQRLQTTRHIVLVSQGKKLQKVSGNTYELDFLNESHIEGLFRQLKNEKVDIKKIVYQVPGAGWENHKKMNTALDNSIYVLFVWVQQWLKVDANARDKQLLYIYPDEENYKTAAFKAVGAFVRSMNLENRLNNFKTLAIQAGELTTSQQARWVESELNISSSQGEEIRYISGKRHVKRLESLALPPFHNNAQGFKEGGTYLITGGMGGLGLILARQITSAIPLNVVLSGRSVLSESGHKILSDLQKKGANVEYMRCDVTDENAVRRLIQNTKNLFGQINGVVHCAGVMKSAFIQNKKVEDVSEIIAPKVYGTLYLDQYTAEEPLDFFILYSSIGATIGSAGQCDYAYANNFMDHMVAYREKLRENGGRRGKSLSINWHLWANGGMQVNEDTQKLFEKTFGMYALEEEDGLNALKIGLNAPVCNFMVVKGDEHKINKVLNVNREAFEGPEAIKSTHTQQMNGETHAKKRLLEKDLTQMVSGILKIDMEDIELDTGIDEYGFESVSFTEFANTINEHYGLDLMPSVFFEHATLASLVEYLLEEYPEILHRYDAHIAAAVEEVHPSENLKEPMLQSQITDNGIGQKPIRYQEQRQINIGGNQGPEPIAIVGLDLKMPGANDLQSLWQLLEEGRDVLTEVPGDRWDVKTPENSKYKWGGFLDNVFAFDAPFFSISPAEARYMDPQQRLLLESVWKTIEDAGYKASEWAGKNVGVFVGVATADYDHLLRANQKEGDFQVTTGNSQAILTNRVSYFFDFRGPSEPVNTACSSSLVALHKGVEALRNKTCEMCIVSGVNIILDPSSHIAFGNAGVLSETGKARVLDQDADGYVRSEGIGTVMLKPLAQAIADNDHIYATIRSTHVNHGGRVNSVTTPNPNAQAALIAETLRKANIDPLTLDYIELQGIGLPLADSIEFNGLHKAFKMLYEERQYDELPVNYCGIGAVKSNLGHMEAAAGMAGLFKVLLSMKHNKLLKNANFNSLNPQIKITGTPFYVLDTNRNWDKPDSQKEAPRRAGVSTFGFGGVNAHVLLEQYHMAATSQEGYLERPMLFTLSAKNKDCLKAYINSILRFIDRSEVIPLADFLYTLQVGREAMPERIAVVVDSKDQLTGELKSYLGIEDGDHNVLFGNAKQRKEMAYLLEGEEGQAYFEALMAKQNLRKLAQLWVQGIHIEWETLYEGQNLKRISAPTYPFMQTNYHFDDRIPTSIEEPSPVNKKPEKGQNAVLDEPTWQLTNMVAGLLGMAPEEVPTEESLHLLGLESMKAIKLLSLVEEQFDVKLSMKVLFRQATVQKLAGIIKSKHKEMPLTQL